MTTPDASAGGTAAAAPAPTLLTSPPAAAGAGAGGAAVPPPAAAWTWADDTGKFSAGWQDRLGAELKGDTSLRTIDSLPTLAKAYVDTKKMIGKKVTAPTDSSTPEEVAAWRALTGAPEKPEDYGDLRPKDVPAEAWDTEIETAARALAHKYHLPPGALKDFVALNVQGTKAAYARETAAAQQQLEAGQMSVRKEWGEHFERNRNRALAVAAALGIPETDDIFVSRPDLMIKLATAAPSVLGGDKIVNGSALGITGGIADQIRTIQDSPEYNGKRGATAQQQAQARLHQLYAAQDVAKQAA